MFNKFKQVNRFSDDFRGNIGQLIPLNEFYSVTQVAHHNTKFPEAKKLKVITISGLKLQKKKGKNESSPKRNHPIFLFFLFLFSFFGRRRIEGRNFRSSSNHACDC